MCERCDQTKVLIDRYVETSERLEASYRNQIDKMKALISAYKELSDAKDNEIAQLHATVIELQAQLES